MEAPLRTASTDRTSGQRSLLAYAGVAALCALHLALGLRLLPGWMFAKYPDAARLLASQALPDEQGADFSPLYLLLNVALAPRGLRLFQSLAGASSIVAAYVLGRRLFSPKVGLVACALLALAEPLLLYEATLEPDLLVMVANTWGLTLLTFPGGRAYRLSLLAAASLLGLSAALRPTGLLVLGVCAVWLAIQLASEGRRAFATWTLAFLVVGLSLAVVPTALVRRWAHFESKTTMSAGVVLHMGNRPEGIGLGAVPTTLIKSYEAQLHSAQRPDYAHALYRRFARAELGQQASAAQTELFWFKKVVALATEEPSSFLGLWGRKLTFFLFGPDGHDLVEVRRAEHGLAAWPFLSGQLLSTLGMGALLFLLMRRAPVGLLLGYWAASVTMVLLFYVVARYRLPMDAPLAILLAATLSEWVEQLEQKQWRRVAVLTLILGGAAWLPQQLTAITDLQRVFERTESSAAESRALAEALGARDYDTAARFFERLQAAHPFTSLQKPLRGVPFESRSLARRSEALSVERFGLKAPVDQFFAAELARRAGHCDAALPAAQLSAAAGVRQALYDTSLDPHLVAADCLLTQGHPEDALEQARASLRQRGGTLDALAFAAAGAMKLSLGEAREWNSKLFALHDKLSALHARGAARLRWNDPRGALEDADAVLAVIPDLAITLYLRASALTALARDEDAIDAYALALRFAPGFNLPTVPLDPAIERQLAAGRATPKFLAIAAEHQLRAGRLNSARDLAARASGAAPFEPGLQQFARDLASARAAGGPLDAPPEK